MRFSGPRAPPRKPPTMCSPSAARFQPQRQRAHMSTPSPLRAATAHTPYEQVGILSPLLVPEFVKDPEKQFALHAHCAHSGDGAFRGVMDKENPSRAPGARCSGVARGTESAVKPPSGVSFSKPDPASFSPPMASSARSIRDTICFCANLVFISRTIAPRELLCNYCVADRPDAPGLFSHYLIYLCLS